MQFEVNGQTYQNTRLNVFKQSYVLKRLLPVFTSVTKSFSADGVDLEPLGLAFSELSDEASDFVFNTCLSTVQRKQGDVWASIKNGNAFMFEDIDLAAMLEITANVIKDNYNAFFLRLPTLFNQAMGAVSNGQN